MAGSCEHVMNFRVPLRDGEFLDYLSDCWLVRTDCAHKVRQSFEGYEWP